MKIRIICWAALLMVIASMLAAPPALAQSNPPCGGRSTKAFIDWPQFHSDACHTGYNPNEFILSPATVGNLVVDWTYRMEGVDNSSFAVANGVVYVGSGGGYVYALNAATGTLLWNYRASDAVYSSPAVANGVVYVGCNGGTAYALNAATGAQLWSFTTSEYMNSSPAVANGVVYVGSDDDNVYALNAATGAKLWSYTTGSAVESSPAVANGVVYVGSYDKNVYALNAATGAKLWSYPFGGDNNGMVSSPAVTNGMVYGGSWQGFLYAFHLPLTALSNSGRDRSLRDQKLGQPVSHHQRSTVVGYNQSEGEEGRNSPRPRL